MIELPARELPALCRSPLSSSASPPLLLDVREPWEVALAPLAVEGAALLAIPMQQLPARLAELAPSRRVVCVCHHGVRSRHVAAWLERAGFGDVYNLAGGVDAWSREVDPSVPRY
jgi:rhodanese-related sulfurtransferase